MATQIRQTQIATHGLGDVTSQNVWEVAFPDINFIEIFGDETTVIELAGSVSGTSTAGGALYVAYRTDRQEAGGGVATPARRRRDESDDDLRARRVTRIRTYSILSEEVVRSPVIRQILAPRSITSNIRFGNPVIEIGVNDEEEIILMLLAA